MEFGVKFRINIHEELVVGLVENSAAYVGGLHSLVRAKVQFLFVEPFKTM